MNAFKTMFEELTAMQLPIITVKNLPHKSVANENTTHHLIIIPDGKDKITVFTFEQGSDKDDVRLVRVKSEDMLFDFAIREYANYALRIPGAVLSLYAL